MTLTPGKAAYVVDVAHAIETRRVVRIEHAAAEEAVLRIRLRRTEELLEPVGPREGIRVE